MRASATFSEGTRSCSSSSTSSSAGDDKTSADEFVGADEIPDVVPDFIEGQRVRFSTPGPGQRGLIVSCNNPAHGPRCAKYRSLFLERDLYGPHAATYYLGACLRTSFDNHSVPHSRVKPTKAMVRAYMADHEVVAPN